MALVMCRTCQRVTVLRWAESLIRRQRYATSVKIVLGELFRTKTNHSGPDLSDVSVPDSVQVNNDRVHNRQVENSAKTPLTLNSVLQQLTETVVRKQASLSTSRQTCSEKTSSEINHLSPTNLKFLMQLCADKSSARYLEKLKDAELLFVFKQLPNFPLATHNFMPILIALDNECCRRARQWDLATCLVYLDEFYRVKKKQGPYAFPRHIVTQWTEMIMSNCSISVPHLMAYLHSLKLVRSFPKDLVQVKLENRILQLIDQLTMEDLAVVSDAFFLCKKNILSIELVDKIAYQLLENASKLNSDSVVNAFLKIFYKSTINATHSSRLVLQIQPCLLPYINRWSPMTLTRFISVGNNAMWFHSASIERVLELFLTGYWERYHWPPPRLKDLERLTTVVSLSCHQSPRVGQYLRFLSTELAKRERLAEIEDHPCSLVSLVAHCAYLQHYPHDLLNIVLRPDIVQSVIDQNPYNNMKRELLLLHRSVALECPSYRGSKLSDQQVQDFVEACKRPLPTDVDAHRWTGHERFAMALLETTRKVLGGNELATVSVLQPYFMVPEVTFRADKNGQWLPVSEWQDGPGTKTQQQRFAILVCTRNHIGAHRNNPPPTGPFRFKVRQLKLLGYRVDVVPFHLFMLVSDEKRLDLVLNLIKRLR